jgi:hypothetical protein
MSPNKKVPRPKDELKTEIADQLQLLKLSCQSFDNGIEAAAKHISLNLRVLLHHRGNSRSLLDQLGLRSGRYFSSVPHLNPKNLLTECGLVMMSITSSGGQYLPLIAGDAPPMPMCKIDFADWWNNPVFKDNLDRKLCRRELVLNVADTDGGAHVDPDLDEVYMAISRKNSLGWFFSNGASSTPLQGRPELACMRQIAHELLCTLNKKAPEFGELVQPVIPRKQI